MPVAASAVYFLNLRGDVLINRLYRDDVGGNMVDAFRMHIMQTKELGTCPVRQIGGCSFFYMRISNVYIVIVVSSNANVACAFKFVVEAVALFKSYFGGAFDEDAIRNNFVLIYELLDEIMDFGYPQNLSPEILKLYITQEGVRSPFSSKATDKPVPNATLQVTGAVGWRREGLVYKKNEVFLDIVESVNLLMSSKGSVLRCDVTGKILMKCFLSGMPDLKLGLNDKIGLEKESQLKARPTKSGKTIELDDVTFHQCVNLTRFNSEKTVSFVPPDGEFELMKYRITEGVNLPFRVLPTIKELGRTRMEVNVKVKSVFGAKMFALGVVIKIPVPKQTAKTSFQVTSGRAKYNASIDCLVWKIRKFPGQTEPTMSAEVELISTMQEKKSWTRPPIQMEFQVPMFTASGLRVRFLKVWEKSGYNTVEWVRYITKAGSYEIRRIAGFLGFAKDDAHDVRDREDDDNDAQNPVHMQPTGLPRKGFSVPVQVAVERPQSGPVLVPCDSGHGGVQGLRWYAKRLRMDEDGDVADEFVDEVLPQTPTNTENQRKLPRFEVKYNARPVKVKSQVLSVDGKIQQCVEHQGKLQWV
ncbi:hypothetical protein FNV43_RR10187 [Rhamnella rubrinervis]|uniref:MHD domain-containing protein n=1 Tax=Rhamnella rubrinervis TaxID=2594499 RepID=A0A8K0HCP4_9ROSA|nr:hypothetical protein FNV43_RR10187 [Rhamnella rubrinervis]